jgi:uncharacterized protein
MAQRADSFELSSLGLSSGEAKSADVAVGIDPLEFGDQTYAPGGEATARLDVSHTTSGYALRLRFGVELHGPCMRCLEDADAAIEVDAREVDQPGDADELRSPYVDGDEVDVRAWARDALALALPTQIFCRPDCLGLCAVCGANLNEDPGHAHESEPDPRWAKLDELKLE